MPTYVIRNGELVEKHLAPPKSSGPYVQSDYLPPMPHPATGKIMDSKSQFRSVTRSKGLTEVGNEKQKDTRNWNTPDLVQEISRAYDKSTG